MTRRDDERASELRDRLITIGALAAAPVAFSRVQLMHAAAGALPEGPGWLYEIKFDGYRVLAGRASGRPRVYYRRGSEGTGSWPEVAAALDLLSWEHVILDGELVVLDGDRPKFSLVQERFGVTRPQDALHAAHRHPAQLMVFDLLALEDLDLRGLPLVERKAALTEVLAQAHPVLRYVEHVESATEGAEIQRRSRELGGEGVLVKRARSRYLPGRSRDWIKVRSNPTMDALWRARHRASYAQDAVMARRRHVAAVVCSQAAPPRHNPGTGQRIFATTGTSCCAMITTCVQDVRRKLALAATAV